MATLARHALVIGGSMAGLLAARVLADHFERVTIIERDHFPLTPAPRRGLPQARHAHILLARGRDDLEELFPGIQADLLSQDAQLIDVTSDLRWLGPTGWAVRFRSGITIPACTRDLLDWVVRQRLAAYSQIRFIENAEVRGLEANVDRTRVTGVQISRKETNAELDSLRADLVIDASGRGSHAPQWLGAIGYPLPQETVVTAFIGYSSRVYTRPSTSPWEGLLVQQSPPNHLRGGVLYPLGKHRWMATLAGVGGDYPPTDEPGFLAFARSLRDPLLYDTITDLEPLSPIAGSRSTENRLRHYERLPRRPEGFMVLGDAVCAFNPVYGQGMTAAALAALTLRSCLRHYPKQDPPTDLTGLATQFQRRLARANKPIWLLATGEDFRYPHTVGGQRTWMTKLAHLYIDRIIRQAVHDRTAYKHMAEVIHLLKSPVSLVTPPALVNTLRSHKGANPASAQ